MASESQRLRIPKETEHTTCKDEQKTEYGLWGAKPDCEGKVTAQWGGGIKCDTCGGWFCF